MWNGHEFSQVINQWRTLVKKINEFWVQEKIGKFMTSWIIIDSSRRASRTFNLVHLTDRCVMDAVSYWYDSAAEQANMYSR